MLTSPPQFFFPSDFQGVWGQWIPGPPPAQKPWVLDEIMLSWVITFLWKLENRSSHCDAVGYKPVCSCSGCCGGAGSIPGQAQWVKGSGPTCGSDLIPGPWTFIRYAGEEKSVNQSINLTLAMWDKEKVVSFSDLLEQPQWSMSSSSLSSGLESCSRGSVSGSIALASGHSTTNKMPPLIAKSHWLLGQFHSSVVPLLRTVFCIRPVCNYSPTPNDPYPSP